MGSCRLEIAHLGSCPLGNCQLGSRPWENACGKVPNIPPPLLGNSFFSRCYRCTENKWVLGERKKNRNFGTMCQVSKMLPFDKTSILVSI